MEIVEGEGTVSEINVGYPIVTNGDLWRSYTVRDGDAALPKLVWDFLFLFIYDHSSLNLTTIVYNHYMCDPLYLFCAYI